ncbi:RNA-binding protein [Bacillus cereus]|nr:RNA-binding protein [Bacillus cereus]HDR8452483.1 RNA-binding protein [Bacillus cereus]HDR8464159.1 RNA-binding protein [Bacillus cereus]
MREVQNQLEHIVNQNEVLRDSLQEVLQGGIGDQVQSVSKKIESYGYEVDQSLKDMDWNIQQSIHKYSLRLYKLSEELQEDFDTRMTRSTFHHRLVIVNLLLTPILIIFFLIYYS